MSRNQHSTPSKAYAELQAQLSKGKAPPSPAPTRLGLMDIRLCKEVFQHRRPAEHISGAHIKGLAKTPQLGRDLAPITVWWGGRYWLCVDGHHRIEAYKVAKKHNAFVPVEVFDGSLEAAFSLAAESNTKDKLAMSHSEKMGAAWKLTVLGTTFSIAQVAELSGASPRTVASMRKVKSTLLGKDPEQDLSELSWREAQAAAKGKSLKEVDWEEENEKRAQEIANHLLEYFGILKHSQRETFVRALEIYDSTLPSIIVEGWSSEEEDDEEPEE